MHRRLLSAFALTSALVSTSPSFAQSPPAAPEKIAVGDWQLSPQLEVRTRGEYRSNPPDVGGFDFYGRLTPRVSDAWLVSERARLGLGVERGAVRAEIVVQDARALGTTALNATTGAAGFGPYAAFFEVHGTGTRPTYVRMGRQPVVWGEGRLIGTADFSPVGRSLDALRAHAAAGTFDFEALAALLEAPSPLGRAFGDATGVQYSGVQLYGLSSRWTLDPLFKVEAFGLARVSRSNGQGLDGSRFAAARLSGETYTVALRASGEGRGWDYGVEGAYQFGTASSLAITDLDVAAYAVAAHVDKKLDQLLFTPTFRIEGSYASGDDGSGKYKQFDPLLADPQRFHGPMDLFAWSNMMDVGGRVQIVPWNDTTFALGYRYARLVESSGEWIGSYLTAIGKTSPSTAFGASGYVASLDPPSSDLGHELDASFGWRPLLPLDLRLGWSALFLGDGARRVMESHVRAKTNADNTLRTSTLSQYAYVQATLSMP